MGNHPGRIPRRGGGSCILPPRSCGLRRTVRRRRMVLRQDRGEPLLNIIPGGEHVIHVMAERAEPDSVRMRIFPPSGGFVACFIVVEGQDKRFGTHRAGHPFDIARTIRRTSCSGIMIPGTVTHGLRADCEICLGNQDCGRRSRTAITIVTRLLLLVATYWPVFFTCVAVDMSGAQCAFCQSSAPRWVRCIWKSSLQASQTLVPHLRNSSY